MECWEPEPMKHQFWFWCSPSGCWFPIWWPPLLSYHKHFFAKRLNLIYRARIRLMVPQVIQIWNHKFKTSTTGRPIRQNRIKHHIHSEVRCFTIFHIISKLFSTIQKWLRVRLAWLLHSFVEWWREGFAEWHQYYKLRRSEPFGDSSLAQSAVLVPFHFKVYVIDSSLQSDVSGMLMALSLLLLSQTSWDLCDETNIFPNFTNSILTRSSV